MLIIMMMFFSACSSNADGEPAEIRQLRNQFYGIWQDDGSTLMCKLILKRNNTFRLENSGCFGEGRWLGKWTVLPEQVLLEVDDFFENGRKSAAGKEKMFVLKDGVLFEDYVGNGAGYRKVK
ncbi:hypothetical protein LZZ85_01430 [Terrimonas sp. NA20]|uniref:Alkaline proteinase inhibitor/ Outer membrane lipoprotein Omp19 domain-containing protein n=1 Tax=Terrimonas ginsenosidimutans TaxID=2908004 RepID=A0ABS9KKP9_9BACT|nr:hypothetical protein [Terrimonas ginsenosidimutans]MCG2612913.1 hypothetical protein [Terrimonas ginsenosidimutans]